MTYICIHKNIYIICIYFGLRDLAINTSLCGNSLVLVLAMIALCFFVLLVGAPPVVQGAHAFGHILALTMPEDVPWCPGFFSFPGTAMSCVDSIPG